MKEEGEGRSNLPSEAALFSFQNEKEEGIEKRRRKTNPAVPVCLNKK